MSNGSMRDDLDVRHRPERVRRPGVGALRVVAEPRTAGRGAREVARELLLEHRGEPALGGGPGVVAVLVVAGGGVEVEVVVAEALDVLRVVRRRGQAGGCRALGGVADRAEVAGVVRVAAPAAVDQVAGDEHRVRLLALPVVQDVVDRALVRRAGGVRGPARVPEARAPAQVGDVGVEEVRARQQPQPPRGVRRPGQDLPDRSGGGDAAVRDGDRERTGCGTGPDLDRHVLGALVDNIADQGGAVGRHVGAAAYHRAQRAGIRQSHDGAARDPHGRLGGGAGTEGEPERKHRALRGRRRSIGPPDPGNAPGAGRRGGPAPGR